MDRRHFLALTAALSGCRPASPPPGDRPPTTGVASDASASELLTDMQSGRISAAQLTQHYLDRIARLDRQGPELRAVLETNPAALESARLRDRERAAGQSRGPLHGLPVLIKDNIETADRMMTTAGSLALEGWYAPADAPLVAQLRRAGAVILGKSNLSEWANIRSTHSSSGWSARGGQTRNPFDRARSPSGSSSGSAVAVAAGLCALAVGTETDGSIVSPASACGIVGLKPTIGLISRSGIIPIAHSQDTAGPMTRSVADAALLLGTMCSPEADEAASNSANDRVVTDYTRYLANDGLRGARLGVARSFFGGNPRLNRVLDVCVGQLRDAGAEVIDPVDLADSDGIEAAELEVLLYELKAGLNDWLRRLPTDFRVRTLSDIIHFNEQQRAREMPHFEQELFLDAEAKGPLTDTLYLQARGKCGQAARVIDRALARDRIDAIVALTSGPAWLIDHVNGDSYTGGCSSLAAVAGFPHISVPATRFEGLPIGLSFFGTAFSEATLLKLASGYEYIRGALPPPLP
jgi:amidase